MFRLFLSFSLIFSFALQGCGYHFRSEKDSYLTTLGVEKIYLQGITNETNAVGIEHLVLQALTRSLLTSGSVRIVQNESDADATMSGIIRFARYDMVAGSASANIFPGPGNVVAKSLVATEYEASLECQFTLKRAGSVDLEPLFSEDFSNSRRFTGSNQKGSYGTTSSLINDNEFVRAISELTTNMMRDVQESLLSRF